MRRTLLLADDSTTIQKVVAIAFSHEDFTVLAVGNGEQAIARARDVKPAVVLADVTMPGLTGYDLCAAIKADPITSRIPVLLLTGAFTPFDEERGRAVGVDDHLAKPFETAELIDRVRRLVNEAPAGRAIQEESVAAPPLRPPAPPAPVGTRNARSLAAITTGLRPSDRPSSARSPASSMARHQPVRPPSPAPSVASLPLGDGPLAPPPPPPATPLPRGAATSVSAPTPSTPPAGRTKAAGREATPDSVVAPAALSPASTAGIVCDEDVAVLYDDLPAATPEAAPLVAPPGPLAIPPEQIEAAVAAISRELIEKIAWEVVPRISETVIREYLDRLLRARQGERK